MSDKVIPFKRPRMSTQMQATPILYGEDARRVIEEMNRKPTARELEAMEKRRKFFSRIAMRGIRRR